MSKKQAIRAGDNFLIYVFQMAGLQTILFSYGKKVIQYRLLKIFIFHVSHWKNMLPITVTVKRTQVRFVGFIVTLFRVAESAQLLKLYRLARGVSRRRPESQGWSSTLCLNSSAPLALFRNKTGYT